MHAEGLYDDEDRSTDEGVLIRIKLKAITMCLLLLFMMMILISCFYCIFITNCELQITFIMEI